MHKGLIAMLAFAGGLAAAGPAWAQGAYQPRVSFEMEGVRYGIAAPKGYCRATGAKEAEFQRFNSLSDFPLLIALIPCDPNRDPTDYILIKHAPNDKRDRKALLAQFAADFPTYDADETNKSIAENVGGALDRLVGEKVDMTFDIRPLGVDDVCAYMAGNSRFDVGGRTVVMSMVVCATAIDLNPMMIQRYLPAAARERVLALPGEVRAMALSLKQE